MKKFTTLGALILAAQFAYAQPPMGKPPCGHNGPPTVEQRVQRMQENLGLSDDQAAQIKAIMNSHEEQRQSLQKQLRQLHEQERQQVEALLTDEQKQKLANRFRGPSRDDR